MRRVRGGFIERRVMRSGIWGGWEYDGDNI
jgi:hypothetical protein